MPSEQPPPGIRKAPTRSRLLAKYGKARALNPFAEEEKRAIINMAEGTSVLLGMHNTAELTSLCGVMCLGTEGTNKEKKERILRFVADETMRTHNPEKAYSALLHLMWEGILFEYLRAMGQPLKSAELDPRVYTLLFWRKRALEQHEGTFRPHYVQRQVRSRFIDEKLDDDLRALLNGVAAKEVYVKESEKRIKGNNDYRNVVMYLAAVTDMHDFEQDARSYLMDEVSMLRGRMDHAGESLELTRSQAHEMEGKHHVMASEWCKTLAAQEASVDAYVGMLNDQLCDRNAMAGIIEEFLESHGGREGNKLHPTSRSDLSDLVPRLLARYELDMLAASEEATRDSGRLRRAHADLRRTSRVLAFETARADAKERECEWWAARHAALQRKAAERVAQLEAEVGWLIAEAGSGMVERVVTERRFDLVRPGLEAMLVSGKADDEAKAVTLLETLGIMDRDGIAQHLEGFFMQREDIEQRTAIAAAAGKNVPAGGGAGKSPKKGGKKKK